MHGRLARSNASPIKNLPDSIIHLFGHRCQPPQPLRWQLQQFLAFGGSRDNYAPKESSIVKDVTQALARVSCLLFHVDERTFSRKPLFATSPTAIYRQLALILATTLDRFRNHHVSVSPGLVCQERSILPPSKQRWCKHRFRSDEKIISGSLQIEEIGFQNLDCETASETPTPVNWSIMKNEGWGFNLVFEFAPKGSDHQIPRAVLTRFLGLQVTHEARGVLDGELFLLLRPGSCRRISALRRTLGAWSSGWRLQRLIFFRFLNWEREHRIIHVGFLGAKRYTPNSAEDACGRKFWVVSSMDWL